jgi:hypothetical protein
VEQGLVKTLEEIGTLIRSTSSTAGRFRPCAFLDERLDCIRVIARDCSVLEERLNDRITVLIDNYYPQRSAMEYVGFTIKGATHFCKQHGIDTAKSIAVATLLDALLASTPELAVRMFVNLIAKPLVEAEKIDRVEIPDGNLQLA